MKKNLFFPLLVLAGVLLLFLKPPEKANISDIKSALKKLSEAQASGNTDSEITLSKWLEKATSQLTAKLLDKNFCEATWKDIQEALELMEITQSLGYDKLSHHLMDWVRAAFRSYAHRRVNSGAGKAEKLDLASRAQALDLSEVAEALYKGNNFSSGCEEVWEAKFVWHERQTPEPIGVELWDEFELHLKFHFSVLKNGRIKGRGKGEITKYREKIVCENGTSVEAPTKILDPIFPVTVEGIKSGDEIKINFLFSARLKRGPASLQCTDTDAGEIDKEILDIGKGIRSALPHLGGYLLELKVSGKHYTMEDKEAGIFIELNRIR